MASLAGDGLREILNARPCRAGRDPPRASHGAPVRLRSYAHQGFNEDTAGRRTCDGTIVITGAAQKSELNSRFPNREQSTAWSRAGIYPRVIFRFGYGVTTDPVTGATDGILKRPWSVNRQEL